MAKAKAKIEQEKRFSRETLLKDKRFADYQQDFLSAVLSDKEAYTIAEAEKAVAEFFGKKG